MSDLIEKCAKAIEDVRIKSPLVHNITNYVTVNDVANILLASGASPIMADDASECADITAISDALVINIGTLNSRTVESMIISGKTANSLGKPVVFDPVGAGASAFRNETVKKLLSQVKMTVIKGNISEMSYIAGLSSATKGVDVSEQDLGNDMISAAKNISEKYGCAAAVTGETDIIYFDGKIAEIKNGIKALSSVTGTGCMTTGILGGLCAVCEPFTAASAAVSLMGIAGELSFEKYGSQGTGSFHIGIINEISRMNAETFKEKVKIYEL